MSLITILFGGKISLFKECLEYSFPEITRMFENARNGFSNIHVYNIFRAGTVKYPMLNSHGLAKALYSTSYPL